MHKLDHSASTASAFHFPFSSAPILSSSRSHQYLHPPPPYNNSGNYRRMHGRWVKTHSSTACCGLPLLRFCLRRILSQSYRSGKSCRLCAGGIMLLLLFLLLFSQPNSWELNELVRHTGHFDAFALLSRFQHFNFNQPLPPAVNRGDNFSFVLLPTWEPRDMQQMGLKMAMEAAAAAPAKHFTHRSPPPKRILLAVKTHFQNQQHRRIIRQTWANRKCYNQSLIQMQLVFLLGSGTDARQAEILRQEHRFYNDLVQGDFQDAYLNNTYKLMMALRYVNDFTHKHSRALDYVILIDDDYFLNPNTLTEFLWRQIHPLEEEQFVGGYVFYDSRPKRSKWSKWFVTVNNYPYEFYPYYAAGGFVVISSSMAHKLYIILRFMHYFPFDDTLMGVALFHMRLAPRHMPQVLLNKPSTVEAFKGVIASHEFSNSKDLLQAWSAVNLTDNCRAFL